MLEEQVKIQNKIGKDKAVARLGTTISRKKRTANFFIRHYYPFLVASTAIGIFANIFATSGVVAFAGALTAFNLMLPTFAILAAIGFGLNFFVFRKTKVLAKEENKIARKEIKLNRLHNKFERMKSAYLGRQANAEEVLSRFSTEKGKGFSKQAFKAYKAQKKVMLKYQEKLIAVQDKIQKQTDHKFQGVMNKYDNITDKLGAHDLKHKPRFRDNKNDYMYALKKQQNWLDLSMKESKDMDDSMRLVAAKHSERKTKKIIRNMETKKPVKDVYAVPYASKTVEVRKLYNKTLAKRLAFDEERYEEEIARRNGTTAETLFGPRKRRAGETVADYMSGKAKEEETTTTSRKPKDKETTPTGGAEGSAKEEGKKPETETKKEAPKKEEIKEPKTPKTPKEPKAPKEPEAKDTEKTTDIEKDDTVQPCLKFDTSRKHKAVYKGKGYLEIKDKRFFFEAGFHKDLDKIYADKAENEEISVKYMKSTEHNYARVTEVKVITKEPEDKGLSK